MNKLLAYFLGLAHPGDKETRPQIAQIPQIQFAQAKTFDQVADAAEAMIEKAMAAKSAKSAKSVDSPPGSVQAKAAPIVAMPALLQSVATPGKCQCPLCSPPVKLVTPMGTFYPVNRFYDRSPQ